MGPAYDFAAPAHGHARFRALATVDSRLRENDSVHRACGFPDSPAPAGPVYDSGPRLSRASGVPALNDDIPTLRRILAENRVIAMVGLSASWYRPSYFAAKYLLDHGYRVIPITPRYQEVLGQRCWPTLKDIPEPVDVVDCFRPARDIPPLAQDAVDIGARVLWMQLGIVSEEAAVLARDAGLDVVMNRCMKIEFARLFGGLGWVGVDTKVISGKRSMYVTH
jgi:predicted CoA-binding protein